MVSTLEVDKIETWMKNYLPELRFSRQEIREMCTGPLKDIFLNFLVPRFRTDEQIEVIRSNLYVYGVTDSLPSIDSQLDQELEDLYKELDCVDQEKQMALKEVTNNNERLQDALNEKRKEESIVDEVAMKRNHLENLRHMGAFITSLLDLLEQVKPQLIPKKDNSEDEEDKFSKLKEIQDESIHLFRWIFLQKEPTNATELLEKNKEIHRLITQVVSGLEGLSSLDISQWHKIQLEEAVRLLEETKSIFESSCDSLHLMAEEHKKTNVLLTKQHIDEFKCSNDLVTKIKDVAETRQRMQMKLIDESYGQFAASDFLKLVRKEELHQKLKKCREIRHESCEVTRDICIRRTSNYNQNGNLSMSSISPSEELDGVDHMTLEDMTSSLINNWNETRSQLIDTAKKGSKILEQDVSKLKRTDPLGQGPGGDNSNNHSIVQNQSLLSSYYYYDGAQQRRGHAVNLNTNSHAGHHNEDKRGFNLSQETSLSALNPNSENWRDMSFIRAFSERNRNEDRGMNQLLSHYHNLEQTYSKTGTATLDILHQLIIDAKNNLKKGDEETKWQE